MKLKITPKIDEETGLQVVDRFACVPHTFTKSKLAEGEILINGVNVPKRFYSHQRVYAIEDGKLVWNDELEARYGK